MPKVTPWWALLLLNGIAVGFEQVEETGVAVVLVVDLAAVVDVDLAVVVVVDAAAVVVVVSFTTAVVVVSPDWFPGPVALGCGSKPTGMRAVVNNEVKQDAPAWVWMYENPKTGDRCKAWAALSNIITRESGWDPTAENPSGAYGLGQALPGSKMATAGSDWASNPRTQIKWMLGYIRDRYGDPQNAWTFWQAHNWY